MFHVLELRDFTHDSRSGAYCAWFPSRTGSICRQLHTLKKSSGFAVVKCKVCMSRAHIAFHVGKTMILAQECANSIGELTPERGPKSTPPGSGEPLG